MIQILLLFETNRSISFISICVGLVNLICQRLSSCNRLCHGCNLLLLVQATCTQHRLRSAGAAAKWSRNMLQRQLSMLVCVQAHNSVRGAKLGQTCLIEMSILKPPKFLISPPPALRQPRCFKTVKSIFHKAEERPRKKKRDLPLSHACLRVHTHSRGCQVNQI